MYKNRRIIRCSLVMLWVLCCITVSCGKTGNKDGDNDDKHARTDSLKNITATAEVSEGCLNDELILNGDVTCDETKVSKVYIPCRGKIQGVNVELGDYVKQGQCLASVFSQDAADYEKQQSDLNTEIRLAQRELVMKQDLHKSGMASDRDVEEAKGRVEMAKAEKTRLQNVAHVNGFSGKSHAVIQAPKAGYVFAKNVYNGSYIDESNNDIPAFEIVDLNSVWIVADVYEGDIRKVKQDAKVYVTVLAYPHETIVGCIDKIYHNLDSQSKTMKVRVRLDNSKGLLMPGMFANVHVLLSGTGKRMLQVPVESIVFENGNNYVVLSDSKGRYRRQEVKVLRQDGRFAFIERGVSLGDRVVCKNALLVYNTLK